MGTSMVSCRCSLKPYPFTFCKGIGYSYFFTSNSPKVLDSYFPGTKKTPLLTNFKSLCFFQVFPSIWANYNNSHTWNKAILGWFPLLTMVPGFGRSEVVIKFTQINWIISSSSGLPSCPELLLHVAQSIFPTLFGTLLVDGQPTAWRFFFCDWCLGNWNDVNISYMKSREKQ